VLPVLPEEVPNRLRLCTDLIENTTGVRPVSFRCPRLFGSTAVVNALDELGYVPTPPIHVLLSRAAYAVSSEPWDWTRAGDLRIVELPNFANLAIESKDVYGRDLDQWPIYRTEGADAIFRHVDGFIEYARARAVPPFLCFYFHPWSFTQCRKATSDRAKASFAPIRSLPRTVETMRWSNWTR